MTCQQLIDCECPNETPTRRYTEGQQLKVQGYGPDEICPGEQITASMDFDIIECTGCGNVDFAKSSTEICVMDASPRGPSDCDSVVRRYLMRKDNRWYVKTVETGELGSRVLDREFVTPQQADEIVKIYCSGKCQRCGRDLKGRSDWQVPHLCHVCASVQYGE